MTKTRETPSVAKLERLLSIWTAYCVADKRYDGSMEAARRVIRLQNELVDACVDCGMRLDGDEFAFAEGACMRFLTEAA